MTLYMLFAAVGILIHIGPAVAAAIPGVSDVHLAVGPRFALWTILSLCLGAVIIFRERHHLAMVTAVFVVSAIALAAASVEDPHYTSAANATVRAPVEVFAAEPSLAREAGEKLFRELGCIGCHYPDDKGIGPSLNGLFGSPVTEAGGGALTVDEEYVREAILNPSAAVAAGVAPVMPTFAGRVTEEQLRALIAYVKSLSLGDGTVRGLPSADVDER